MITPPADAKYLPEDYLDEMSPDRRASPNDWVKGRADGSYILVGWDEAMDDDPDDSDPRVLSDGDIVLFAWSRTHGMADITIAADGKWTAARPLPAPVENEQMMCAIFCDWETATTSVEELAQSYLENHPAGGEEPLVYYSWSNKGVPFEFRAGEFHQIEAV